MNGVHGGNSHRLLTKFGYRKLRFPERWVIVLKFESKDVPVILTLTRFARVTLDRSDPGRGRWSRFPVDETPGQSTTGPLSLCPDDVKRL